MTPLYRISLLRRLFIPILKMINLGDITIRHHWTDDRFTLHSFKHRGYWYHGKKRETATMLLLSNLVSPGDFIIEIGGHIGYISLYLAQLIGPRGTLIVFEPGPNNLPYIRRNTKFNPRIFIVDQAITDYVGSANFHIEDLSGQNNSLLDGYIVYERNKKLSFLDSLGERVVEVACTTLDAFLLERPASTPSFVKVDVEGAELTALKGMQNTLGKKNVALMVEVTQNASSVFDLLSDADFHLFRPDRRRVNTYKQLYGNIFCVKNDDERLALFSRSLL